MTASVRALHGIDGSRRPDIETFVDEEAADRIVVVPDAAPAPARTPARSPGPKHRRPSRLQQWWRPERPAQAQALTPTPTPASTNAVTRSLLELNEERFQAIALRLDRLNDELAGIATALGGLEGYLRQDRAQEIDRARWLLGDKLSALLADLAG